VRRELERLTMLNGGNGIPACAPSATDPEALIEEARLGTDGGGVESRLP
jgi:hypothetical protein